MQSHILNTLLNPPTPQVNSEYTSVQMLQMAPMGVIKLISPLNNRTATGLELDIFAQPALRGGALRTLETHGMVLSGPQRLVNGNFAAIARLPIFIRNATAGDTFGTDRASADPTTPLRACTATSCVCTALPPLPCASKCMCVLFVCLACTFALLC